MNTREIIEQRYGEFPETLLNAELCRACARADGRSVKQALKGFAIRRQEVVKNGALKGVLRQMENGMFPETEINRIRACIGRMEAALVKNQGTKRS